MTSNRDSVRVAGSNIFNGATHTIPLVDVSYIRRNEAESGPFHSAPEGIIIFLRTTSSTIFLHGDEADEFKRAWGDCRRKMDAAAVEGMRVPIASVDGDEFIKLISTCLKKQQDIDARRAKQAQPTPAPDPLAVDPLSTKMRADLDYAWEWQEKIAGSYFEEIIRDTGLDGYKANKLAHRGAANFMRRMFGVETTDHPDYPRQA